jgi:trehalose-phosphatase
MHLIGEGLIAWRRTPRASGRRRVARHLFDCWPQVARTIGSARRLALFMDFDGTLVALRRRPGDVKPLDLPLRRVLSRLAGHKCLNVYVISGRPLRNLRRLVPVPDVHLLGLHGWEGRDMPPLTEERRLVRIARRRLDQTLSNTPQIRLEDKALGLAVHYRGAAPSAVRRARVIVRQVLRTLGPRLHLLRGHKVWELLPSQISGKGSAVSALLSKLSKPTLAIFVGDDTTDESAFKVLPRGVTIRVDESRRTNARYFLRDPEEVKMFLLKLEAEIV